MATTTTNFGWDIPQSTDLVKDGATAIAGLGQDIDTAFVDFKGGTTGQVLKKTSNTDLDVEWGTASSGLTLINTTSFSGVSSQSFNNVFSATYKNYLILLRSSITTGSASSTMRLRVGGSDASGSNYAHAGRFAATNASEGSAFASASATGFLGIYASTQTGWNVLHINYPFEAKKTLWTINSQDTQGGSGYGGGTHQLETSYDGFTLIAPSGNWTDCEIHIFGLAN